MSLRHGPAADACAGIAVAATTSTASRSRRFIGAMFPTTRKDPPGMREGFRKASSREETGVMAGARHLHTRKQRAAPVEQRQRAAPERRGEHAPEAVLDV